MRKEVLFAILVGALVGLAIAFGIWRANKALLPQAKQATGTKPPPTTTPQQVETSQLLLTSPENNTIVSSERVTVEGTAPSEAIVVITTNVAEVITQAGKDGTFKQDIGLEGGVNEVKIAAYDKDGNKSEQVVTVVYSTEFGATE